MKPFLSDGIFAALPDQVYNFVLIISDVLIDSEE